jgi:shikimate kinase
MKLNAINSNILFIGFMGSGKSQIGSELSKRWKRLFLDIDNMIESRERKKIFEIFEESGENVFRDIEREFADEVKKSVQNSIIAVGGGFPTAVKNIKELGFIVYLDIDFDFMIRELSKTKGEIEKRPLLQNLQFARQIYDSRKDIYSSVADIIYKVEIRDVKRVTDEIENLLKERGFSFE